MVLIPAGAFTMGNSIGDTDITDATNVSVTLSGFYMDANLVSFSQWQKVLTWATNFGYDFVDLGEGKSETHPVQSIDWFDAVKWCNARSEVAGLTPVYYTDAALTRIYTNGEVATLYPKWVANGYRLPTEAEWEKAARGGLSGQRFPLGNVIKEKQANYFGDPLSFTYDQGPDGYNAIGAIGGTAPSATSPAGSFAPNGYGLYDMAGNVFQWCWDWYATPYAGGNDPKGPVGPLTFRVLRSCDFLSGPDLARVASRAYDLASWADVGYGFRCVRGL